MPIVIDQVGVPPAARRAVDKVLESSRQPISGLAEAGIRTLSAEAPREGARSAAFPHRVAYLPLTGIGRGQDLRRVAELRSWRFLIRKEAPGLLAQAGDAHKGSYVASATVAPAETGQYQASGLTEGVFVKGTEDAVRAAEELPAVRLGRFEPVLLVAPAIYVTALWLRQLDGAEDIILPIPPTDSALPPLKPLSPEAFMDALASIAARAR